MTTLALITLICLAALVPAATKARANPAANRPVSAWLAASAPAQTARHWPETPLVSTLNYQALKIRQARANRCLTPPVFRWTPGYRVPQRARPQVVNQRRARLAKNRALESRCIPWPWDALAECESGGNWAYNGPSGFDGGLQFLPSTWDSARLYVSGANYAYAWQAPAHVQVRVAQAWLARTSWAQWPACSSALGLR